MRWGGRGPHGRGPNHPSRKPSHDHGLVGRYPRVNGARNPTVFAPGISEFVRDPAKSPRVPAPIHLRRTRYRPLIHARKRDSCTMAQKLWDCQLKNSGIARRNSGILHLPWEARRGTAAGGGGDGDGDDGDGDDGDGGAVLGALWWPLAGAGGPVPFSLALTRLLRHLSASARPRRPGGRGRCGPRRWPGRRSSPGAGGPGARAGGGSTLFHTGAGAGGGPRVLSGG